MKENNIILGCDISKDKIDIAAHRKSKQQNSFRKTYSNTIKGYKNIINQYSSITNNLHVVMEATGNYHIKFIDF
jgi:transposase